MVGPTLDEFVLEGKLRVTAELVVVLLLRVAADDVVGFLLALVDLEALEAQPALGREINTAHVALHASEVRGHSDAICCLANRW